MAEPDGALTSVVIVAYAGPAYVARCLQAIHAQTGVAAGGESLEVIVAYEQGTLPDSLIGLHATTRWVSAPTADPARLRALGVGAATGVLIAITEDHCIPSPTWVQSLRVAHAEHRVAALGGPLEKLTPDTAVSWAAYLLEFGRYQPPVATGDAEYLTDCNVSYQRAALERVRNVWVNEFHETTTHWALRGLGERLVLDSRPFVAQQRTVTLWDGLMEKVRHGGVFGLTRVPSMSAVQRLVRIATTPILPLVLTARSLRLAASRGKGGPALRASLAILVFSAGWAVGELGAYAGITRQPRD